MVPLQENVPPPTFQDHRQVQVKEVRDHQKVEGQWTDGWMELDHGPATPPKMFERQDKGIWDWDTLGSAIGKVAREILESPTKAEAVPLKERDCNSMFEGLEEPKEDSPSGIVASSIGRFAAEAFDAIDSAFGNGFSIKSSNAATPVHEDGSADSDHRLTEAKATGQQMDPQGVPAQKTSASLKLKDMEEKLRILCKDKLFMETELQKRQELIDLLEGEMSALHKKCRQLLLQNEKLKKSQPQQPVCSDVEDQVRVQLESLLREKAILAQDNARLVRENASMHELLSYSMGCEDDEEEDQEVDEGRDVGELADRSPDRALEASVERV